jgi:hypothetical protein
VGELPGVLAPAEPGVGGERVRFGGGGDPEVPVTAALSLDEMRVCYEEKKHKKGS